MVTTFLIGDGASLTTLLAKAKAVTERNTMAGYNNTGNSTASLGSQMA